MAEQVHSTLDWKINCTIGELFANEISVPTYQRPYSWDEENITNFLNDLEYFQNSKYDTYLFGQMIFYKNEDKIEIIDGQQRLTTCIIYLSVLRNLVIYYNLDHKPDFFRDIEDVIGYEKYGIPHYKLALSKTDNDYFENNIEKYYRDAEPGTIRDLKKPRKSSHKRIYNAYMQIYKRIRGVLDSITSNEERAEKIKIYYADVVKKFVITSVTTREMGQAYIVFETLNSRGKDLDASDLLKNYFFKITDADSHIVDLWEKMINDLNAGGESPSTFIRCFCNSRYATDSEHYISKKRLYKFISEEINNCYTKAKEFLDGLFSACEDYLALKNEKKLKRHSKMNLLPTD